MGRRTRPSEGKFHRPPPLTILFARRPHHHLHKTHKPFLSQCTLTSVFASIYLSPTLKFAIFDVILENEYTVSIVPREIKLNAGEHTLDALPFGVNGEHLEGADNVQ